MGSSNTQTGGTNWDNIQPSPNAAPPNPTQTNQFLQDFYSKYGFNNGENLGGLNLGGFAPLLGQGNQSGFPSTGLNTGGTSTNPATANLGANLNPDYYGQWLSALPSNMPGGGGAITSQYNTPYTMYGTGQTPFGIDQMGTFQNYYGQPAGLYNPYLGQSSVMGVPGAVNNPYGGFNPGINSYATGVDNYLNQIRQPQYIQQPPTADTSPGNPFAGQEVVHGNTAGWQRSDQDAVAQAQTPYQAAPGTQVDQGVATPGVTPNPMQQANTLGRREMMRRQMGRNQGGGGYPSRYSPEIQAFLNRDPGFGGGNDPSTGQYVAPSRLAWDQHNLRMASGPMNPSYMSPESAARMRRDIMMRNDLMPSPDTLWGG